MRSLVCTAETAHAVLHHNVVLLLAGLVLFGHGAGVLVWASAGSLFNFARVLVLVVDRLCGGVVNPELLGGASDAVGLENEVQQLLPSFVRDVIVALVLGSVPLGYDLGRLFAHHLFCVD